MTYAELAGIGLFAGALTLGAACTALWRFIGWRYAALFCAEALAFGALGIAISLGKLPLTSNQPAVVAGALAAVTLWHIGNVVLWQAPGQQVSRR
ncbi:MAG: hypothetical protein HY332_12910 [Chloroflexi bacterium]|nr:hypothetical protein [Chloroflexota bacterium]